MKLDDLLDCAMPLLAEIEPGDYPYYFGGTCFVTSYFSHLYVVTAKHCLRDKNRDDVRVHESLKSRHFLTLSNLWFDNRLQGDSDYLDWAIFAANWPTAKDAGPRCGPLNLDIVPVATPSSSDKLVVRGYPGELSRVDYEKMSLNWRAFSASAHYVGPSVSMHCHELEFDLIPPVESLDGMSGSPVFRLTPHGSAYMPALAGVLIRGSKESGKGYFIGANVILKALSDCRTQRSER